MKRLSYNQIIERLEADELELISEELNVMHEGDLAQIINDLPNEYKLRVFLILETELASDVIANLHDEVQEAILSEISERKLIDLVDEMDSDEAVDVLADLEDEVSERVLSNLDEEDSVEIRRLMNYDEESAGGLMKTEFISVHRDLKRDQIIEYIRENAEEVENLHYVFVIDTQGKLLGILEITSLLLARADSTAESIMEQEDAIVGHVDMDQEQVAHFFRKYDIYILPVVDDENILLGRITVDDIIDVIDDEASEDAYKMVGLESEDKVFTHPMSSVRKRLPWLGLNLFTALLVSSVVGIFESTIAELSILAVLMPIVAGLGGNSGTQTLTVITRGIALGELTIHNTGRAIFKEVTVGIINGLLIGSAATLLAFLLKGNLMLGAVLGISMVCNMLIAGLVGSVIPVVMKSLKIDPALASSVIITMLTDIGGFASFLTLAKHFLI